MSAFDNVLLPLELQELGDAEARKRARDVLKLVGLREHIHHLPTQLSGGQQQRVSIARSLVTDPEIILADEPTGNLDSENAEIIYDIINRLNKDGLTVVVVTHNKELAQAAGRIISIKDGNIHSN